MRKVTATEKLRAVNEGSMSKKEFVRQMRQEFPAHITQFNGFADSVQILKNRGVIYEVKEEVVEAHVYDERPILNYSLDALDRAIRIELEAKGITTYGGSIKPEDFFAAEKKAKANLEKNPTHYLDLMSGESNKVDKHDKMKETKRGAEDTDVFNALKKATLKEGYTEEQIEAAIQKIRERRAGEHEDGTPKSNDEMGDDEREDFYNDLDSVEEVEKIDVVKEAGKTALIQTMNNAIAAIKGKYGEMPGIAGIIRDFLKTHIDDLAGGADPLDEFENYVDANYDSLSEEAMCPHCNMTKADCKCNHVEEKKGKDHDDVYGDGDVVVNLAGISPGMRAVWEIEKEISEFENSEDAQLVVDNMIEINSEDHLVSYLEDRDIDTRTIIHMVKAYSRASVNEKKGKDHDGDGDIDSDDYMAAKDKAIKKAMSEEAQLKEAVKSIIKKVLTEESLNEAATKRLADWGEGYESFEGVKSVVNDLENVVTEVEAFYDKIGDKIAKIFERTAEFKNDEGLKIGAFIAPSLETSFFQDIRPVTKKGFLNKIQLPKVRTISQADVAKHNSGEAPLGEVELETKQTIYTPNI